MRFLLLGQTEPMKAIASQNNSTVIVSSFISKAAVNEEEFDACMKI